MNISQRRPRVLAIAPSSYGIGFAVFESPTRLIDHGIRFGKRDKNKTCIARVEELIATHDPDILVTEDYAGEGSRRGRRVRSLLRMIARRGEQEGLWSYSYSREQMRDWFARHDAQTKHEIAHAIVKQFPKLSLELPAKRRPWTSESPNMAVFDAVALVMTHYGLNERMGW